MNEENNNLENLRCEYEQINLNLRHFHNSRLIAIGIYLIIFLVALLFTFSSFRVEWGRGEDRLSNLKILWAFFTVIFLAFDVYLELNLHQLKKTAKELEATLKLRQLTVLAKPEITWSYLVVWAMYTVLILFWLIAGNRNY